MIRICLAVAAFTSIAASLSSAQDYHIQLLQVPASSEAPYPLTTTVTGVGSTGMVVGTLLARVCDRCPYPPPFDIGFTYQNGQYVLVATGSLNTWITGINDSGVIVGYYSNTDNYTGSFLLENGLFIHFLERGPTSPWHNANGINNLGEVVGTSQDANSGRGFDVVNKTITFISAQGQEITRVQHINDYGVIVGYAGTENNAWHGFIYNAGSFIPLNYPGATATELTGNNDNGVIAGTYTASDGTAGSFIYRNEEFQPFALPGACTTTVTGINNQGVVYGSAVFASDCGGAHGAEYGFVATPAP